MGQEKAAGGLLKFITCGSVDDGKSTLIGHILYDAKLLYADQEKTLELDSRMGSRGGKLDYSLLLDGLMDEREQGITIDVAYRYFTTERRSFIVADTPGHEEYTRNMAVGASFADLAVILVDASQGVLVQTRRHARICALMGIRSFVFAVNKMDLVDYSEARFEEIRLQIEALRQELSLEQVKIIPLSATEGDNIFDAREQKEQTVTPAVRARRLGQTPFVILTDNTAQAEEVERALLGRGQHTMLLTAEGGQLLFGVSLLQQAGLITVVPAEKLEAATEKELRELLTGPLIDLRAGGPVGDCALYENMISYAFS